MTQTFLALVLSVVVALAARPAPADDLKDGEILDQSNWQKADGLLPPEILKHYKEGGYKNKFVDWPDSKFTMGPDFNAGTEANAGKFTTNPAGTIVDKGTGQQPSFIIGFPFPSIDANEPSAAAKVLWNHFYRTWYFGNLHAESQINWMNPEALERRADVDVYYAYYDGTPADEKYETNPDNFLYRQLSLVVSPADLNGTAALTWRYRDGAKRDLNWAYVPALRRVRATSPANRSDGFIGSDESQDDGPFFDGKVEDFDWKMVGEKEGLRISEETNLQGKASAKWVDGKGWDTDWPDKPYIGYMDPSWKGLAWAPTAAASVSKRKFWVIEGVPHDKYYLYGKLQLWIDRITYQGAWVRKFGWKDELLAIHQVMAWNPIAFTRPNGKVDYLQGGNQAYQCIENIKLNRATVAGIKSSPKAGFYGRMKFNPSVFDFNALSRAGK